MGGSDKAAVTEELIRSSVAQTSQLFGQAVWLFCQSPAHRHLLLTDLDWRLLPPIALRQFRLFQRKGVPYGFVSWALVNEETERLVQRPDFRLRPEDWKSGDRAWIVDVIAPQGNESALIETVRDKALEGKEAKVRPGLLPGGTSR